MVKPLVPALCVSLLAATISAQAGPAKSDQIDNSRIVGGKVSEPGRYPWMVSLRVGSGLHFCPGTLIAEDVVLTAAHCNRHSPKVARVGTFDIKANETFSEALTVRRTVTHPKSHEHKHDLGLVFLNGKSRTTPIKLSSDPTPTGNVTVMGWGLNRKRAPTSLNTAPKPPVSPAALQRDSRLRELDLNLRSEASCREHYPLRFDVGMICAGLPQDGQGACSGDEGGPLILKGTNTMVGVMSWTQWCGSLGYPSVYSSVGYYREWIEEQIDEDKRNRGNNGQSTELPVDPNETQKVSHSRSSAGPLGVMIGGVSVGVLGLVVAAVAMRTSRPPAPSMDMANMAEAGPEGWKYQL